MRGWTVAVMTWCGLACGPAVASAQDRLDLPGCYYQDPPSTQRSAQLAAGVRVDIHRVSEPDAVEEACVLTLRDSQGREVLERVGFGARMLPPVDKDLDGDGVPEGVFTVDAGGGNRCCWNTLVVSLSASPRVRAEVDQALGFLFDTRRHRYVAEDIISFYDLGPDMASAPNIRRLYRLSGSGLIDVTPQYCDQLLDARASGPFSREDEFRLLTPERRRAAASSRDGTHEQTRLAAIGIALQMHTCKRERDADRLLNEVFPSGEAIAIRRRVAEAVRTSR